MTAAPDRAARTFAVERPLALGIVALLVLGGGLFGWGALASIAGAVIAAGQVEIEIREQVVEHLDGGTVGEVLVRDGDWVQAGDVLIRLGDAELRSEAAMLAAEAAELAAQRNRLEAEFQDAAITWDEALVVGAGRDPAVRTILAGQERLFAARRASRAGQAAQLRERIGQTRKQIAGLKAQGGALARQRRFIARELTVHRSLFEKGLTVLPRLMALEREAARVNGQTGDIVAQIAAARGRIAEFKLLILQIGTTRVEDAEAGAREAQARENQVRERLAAVRGKLSRMEVRAPVAGEVFGMTVFATGEVVRPGEPIMKIVPADTGLVVRAWLDPIHVDQVWPGQDAVLRFSAFPARVTPEFEGRVRRVSADAQHDERTGLSWYEVEVTMGAAIAPDEGRGPGAWASSAVETVAGWLPAAAEDRVSVKGEGDKATEAQAVLPGHARELALAPGMPVEVHLRTGDRSPLSYLGKPLTDFFSRSLREE